jgi:hypothetical protein
MRPGYNYGPSLPNVPSDARNLLGLQPTPTPDTAGILAGRAVDPEVQAYLAKKRFADSYRLDQAMKEVPPANVRAMIKHRGGRIEAPTPSGLSFADQSRVVSEHRGAQRKTANIAANTAAEKAGRPQDIVNILSGRLQSQVDAERRKREAKRLSVLEYRKTGEPVTPEMVELRQGLAADLLAGLQPQDYLSTAARAEGAGGRYGRLGPLLTAGAQIHAGQQKEEADRGHEGR